MRMPRLLVDYLLRQGEFDAARELSQASGCDDLVDWDVYHVAEGIMDALRRQNCKPALDWYVCASHLVQALVR